MAEKTTLEELVAFGRGAAEARLVTSTCGNASLRLSAGTFAVTGSGSSLGQLSAAELSVVALADGRHLSGPRPSMESGMHRQAYLARPEVGAVLHCQSRAATLLACLKAPPRDLNFIPEVPAYVRAHAYVAYAAPGSEALALAAGGALAADPDVTVVQLVNHGQLVVGRTWFEVLRRAEFFELACFLASQGHALRTLSAEEAEALRDYGRSHPPCGTR